MHTLECTCEEAQLLEMIANDSEQAFQKLYKLHSNRIYRLGMRYFRCPELSAEAVQDVFMKLWQNRKTLKIGGPIEAWLFTVAKNNILNKLRRQAHEWKVMNQLRDTYIPEDDSMQDKMVYADYQDVLKTTLSGLSDKQYQVFTMARQENLSYNQIAEHLNISPLTVKTHMARALGSIRSGLNMKQLFS